jgi:hypothetical protein
MPKQPTIAPDFSAELRDGEIMITRLPKAVVARVLTEYVRNELRKLKPLEILEKDSDKPFHIRLNKQEESYTICIKARLRIFSEQ